MAAVAVGLLAAGGASAAPPPLRVMGAADLELDTVRRERRRTVFVGRLTDGSLQTGLAARQVVVHVEDTPSSSVERQTVRTGADGSFLASSASCPRRCRLTLQFDGDSYYSRAAYEAQTIEPAKESVSLQLPLARHLDAADSTQLITVRTSVAGRGLSLPVELILDSKTLARIQTSETGVGQLKLPTRRLGRPGKKLLIASFGGNESLNPVRRTVRTVLETAVRVDLSAAQLRSSTDGTLALRGRVRDLLGPIPGAAVSLFALSRHAISTRADAAGYFSAALPAEGFAPGSVDIVARYTPDVIWRRPGQSPTLIFEISAAAPPSLQLYAYSLLGTAVLLGLLALVRLRRQLATRLALGVRTARVKSAAPQISGPEPARGGLRAAHRHTLMRYDHGVSGVAWDPSGDCPVGHALVQLASTSTEVALEADAQGQFSAENLAGGVYQVTVSCPGHLAEQFSLELPHRGQYRQMRVDLVPIRVRILELYHDVAVPLLPRPALWARWTPRELLGHLRQSARNREPEFVELTALLERAYWSGSLADSEMLGKAEAHAAAASSAVRG